MDTQQEVLQMLDAVLSLKGAVRGMSARPSLLGALTEFVKAKLDA